MSLRRWPTPALGLPLTLVASARRREQHWLKTLDDGCPGGPVAGAHAAVAPRVGDSSQSATVCRPLPGNGPCPWEAVPPPSVASVGGRTVF